MKKLNILSTIILGLAAIPSMAASNDYVTDRGSSIEINLHKACESFGGKSSCSIPEYGVTIQCEDSTLKIGSYYGLGYLYCNGSESLKVHSTIPMSSFKTPSSMSKESSDEFEPTSSQHNTPFTIALDNLSYFKISTNYVPTISGVILNTGIPNFIEKVLTGPTKMLEKAYVGVLRNLNDFESQIARSHQGHSVRFKQALSSGLEVLREKEKDGSPANSIVHWKVQESSRIIVALGGILEELLVDYQHVDRLKMAITSMRTLVQQLKKSYGWGKGLSGHVSKASATLLDVVRLEIQELGGIKMAIGADTTQYSKILKVSGTLLSKVNASKSGDMRAQREIYDFLDVWNSKEWQKELDTLVKAGPDIRNIVTPKMVMLIQAMESLEDLTESGFIIPTLD